jgi:hypothetical protein
MGSFEDLLVLKQESALAELAARIALDKYKSLSHQIARTLSGSKYELIDGEHYRFFREGDYISWEKLD